MKSYKRIIIFVLLPLLFPACKPPSGGDDILVNPTDNIHQEINASFAPNIDHTWTFMIYMDADNNLDGYDPETMVAYAVDDIDEMEAGLYQAAQTYPGIASSLQIIVLLDRKGLSGPDDTALYRIGAFSSLNGEIDSPEVYDEYDRYGFAIDALDSIERNMGDSRTLADFLGFCTDLDYIDETDHYGLLFWNHGDGPFSGPIEEESKLRGIGRDDSSNEDQLSMEELQDAITSVFGGTKLDFIGFDACLMAAVETAYEARNLADAMTASMAEEQMDGWDYTALIAGMTSDASPWDGKSLAALAVQTYRDSTQSDPLQTMAAVDLEKMETLKTAVDAFAVGLHQENRKDAIEICRDDSIHFFSDWNEEDAKKYPYFELNDFCIHISGNFLYFSGPLVEKAENVIDALSDTIIAAYASEGYGNYFGPGEAVKRGLFITFPQGNRRTHFEQPYYEAMEWYTLSPLEDTSGHYYGEIDFCTNNSNGTVEAWLELLEAWYDEDNALIPLNTF
ncbi:MAG: hypothetical protein JW881_04325 [Spirochaetales bacterium]|nr:hypothetical protein [Spirochaetales bacterium]